jgi:hypothetical protein
MTDGFSFESVNPNFDQFLMFLPGRTNSITDEKGSISMLGGDFELNCA